jgi:Tol biopolymer transport system component
LHNRDIFIVDADGSNLTRVTTGFDTAMDPAWSPDGGKIAFSAAYPADFYYDAYTQIEVVSTGGVRYFSPAANSATNPAWRR